MVAYGGTDGKMSNVDISNQKQYETAVLRAGACSFFQSFEFGKFQEQLLYRGASWALYISDAAGTSTCLAVRQKTRFRKCWLWVPYGPLGGFREEIFEDLAVIAQEEKAIFARIEPAADWTSTDMESLAAYLMFARDKAQIHPAFNRFTPEHSLVLDLLLSEDELLAQMKQKGRYNINVAGRHGVIVKKFTCKYETDSETDGAGSATRDAVSVFYQLLQKTGNRDKFGVHPKYFYEKLLETLGAQNLASLFLAYAPAATSPAADWTKSASDDEMVPAGLLRPRQARPRNDILVAGAIIVYFKDTATYYFGASDYEYRNFMAPYLLHWEIIRDAKRRGFKKYDFLGIAPATESTVVDTAEDISGRAEGAPEKHPWAGITEFKRKFGGREIVYPAAFDIVYKPLWYKAMKTFGNR